MEYGTNISESNLFKAFDTHFKNQLETNTSKGTYDPEMRRNASKFLFGHDKNLTNEQYEKYGSLLDHNIERSMSRRNSANQYGEVEVRFHKDKVICTWTWDDSLTCDYQPTLVTDPKINSFGHYFDFDGFKSTDSMREFLRGDNPTRYIELQFHGDLTFSSVKSVTFPINVYESYGKRIEEMKRMGVEVYYMKDGKLMKY